MGQHGNVYSGDSPENSQWESFAKAWKLRIICVLKLLLVHLFCLQSRVEIKSNPNMSNLEIYYTMFYRITLHCFQPLPAVTNRMTSHPSVSPTVLQSPSLADQTLPSVAHLEMHLPYNTVILKSTSCSWLIFKRV